ncbi:MAG: bicyclomycin resistance protein, partial [Burkholderiales bacterium]|nr:bicyclomycin resistance protein [Burkholderiales bacterium]
LTPHIFEALFFYDHLARPVKIRPLTAAAMPEVSADFKRFTVRIQPGIYFQDDPAFKGQRRELVAADYVYAIKRFADPANKSPGWSSVEELGFVGLREVRQEALTARKPFNYDREVPGLRAVDRYTLVAREVVEFYGEQIAAHPVGTGPLRLKSWRRSSQIVLERNPTFRPRFYEDEASPGPEDAEGQALLAKYKGKRLPLVDEVVISIIEENQPRWLSFLNGSQDFCERVPEEFIDSAMPGGKVAPNLAKRGIRGLRTVAPDTALTVYNMEHPVIGGYSADKVALRRAISLCHDIAREIEVARHGQAIPAQSAAVPSTTGYDPEFRSEMSEYNPAKARALLDMYGYVDRDGDGYREQPDGSALVLVRRSYSEALQRQLDALWQKSLKAVGLRAEFQIAQWPENLKAAQAGNYMIWFVGSSANQLDGQPAFQRMYGPAAGGSNLSRFKDARFDAIFQRMQGLPNGPERDAGFLELKRISTVYAPYRQHVHRVYTDMVQPWLVGYRRPLFWNRWWHMVDIDASLRPSA